MRSAPAPTRSSTAPTWTTRRCGRWRGAAPSGCQPWTTTGHVDARDEYGFPAGAEAELRQYLARNLDSLRRAIAAGVSIAMGSDAVYSMFGQNTRELGWFVQAGMTPAQALASATIVPARLLRRASDLGRVAPGYRADLVAVEGNPLARIDPLFTGVRWVMKDGTVVVDRR